MKVVFVLDEKQAEKLEDVLTSAMDEGPIPEGWQSNDLKELTKLIEGQMREQEKSRKEKI